MAPVRCKVGIHAYGESRHEPVPGNPGLTRTISTCKRCQRQQEGLMRTPGWCNETICDVLSWACSDGEHPPHDEEQLERIHWQRAERARQQAALAAREDAARRG